MTNKVYDGRYLQEGICGNMNVVTFNGDDIHGVANIPDPEIRAKIIELWNKNIKENNE